MTIAAKIKSFLFQEASLTTRFAVHSLICISILTVVLWFLVSNYLINGILRREWETTAQFVRTEVREFLTAEDFTTKDRKPVGPKFAALLRHITLMPDILRFNVYNPQGVAIWAAVDKKLVGRSFADNDKLQEAIQGKVVANMSSLSQKENVSERDSSKKVVEVFVPIYSEGTRELLGVMEIHKRADSIDRDIREARIVVLLGALCGGLLLYLSLFAIVRQAARKIKEQEENLLKVQSDLVASQRMAAVGEIAGAVAHGIGNPLSSIRAAAQVAKLDCDECQGPDLQQKTLTTLDEIIQQVDRVQKRMRGLLNFAKPMEPRPAPVEINSLLSDIVDVLRPRFAAAGVSPQLDLDRSLPAVQLDANHVEQIFMGAGYQCTRGHAQWGARNYPDPYCLRTTAPPPALMFPLKIPGKASRLKVEREFSRPFLPPSLTEPALACHWRKNLSNGMGEKSSSRTESPAAQSSM